MPVLSFWERKALSTRQWFGSRIAQHTDPVEAGFPAELVGPGGAEVIVWPERLVQGRDEVEQSLPAALVTQRVLSILAALPQPGWWKTTQEKAEKKKKDHSLFFFWTGPLLCNTALAVKQKLGSFPSAFKPVVCGTEWCWNTDNTQARTVR